jgi:hypothetical protein
MPGFTMFGRVGRFGACVIVAAGLGSALHAPDASALPAFARQTGQACAACHVGAFGPQLTSFGRDFKLNGYTLQTGDDTKVPLSAMLVQAYTHTSKDQSGPAGPYAGTNNNNSLQELSLFYAGRISDHLGAFAQATYSDIERKLALDNVELRYSKAFTHADGGGVYGFSLNNNPTVSDVWNTAPAWRFPYQASELAPAPLASPLIAGGLEQSVVGSTAYVFLDHTWYGELGAYKTLSPSVLDKINAGDPGRIVGLAPYWRFAYNHDGDNQTLAFGLSGINARLRPRGEGGPANGYRDITVDGAWQKTLGDDDTVSVNGTYTHEAQSLDQSYAAGDAEHRHASLDAQTLDFSWHHGGTYGATVGLFAVQGSRDHGIYVTEDDAGSLQGKPDSNGATYQIDYTPFGKTDSWEAPFANLRLGLQYTTYSKFNGASSNYDGAGRNASDNNTLFAFLWLAM